MAEAFLFISSPWTKPRNTRAVRVAGTSQALWRGLGRNLLHSRLAANPPQRMDMRARVSALNPLGTTEGWCLAGGSWGPSPMLGRPPPPRAHILSYPIH